MLDESGQLVRFRYHRHSLVGASFFRGGGDGSKNGGFTYTQDGRLEKIYLPIDKVAWYS